ncbi:MAG: glycosyltransferase family 4 protein, partial [Candidatus Thermoplasmatota archaeon]|nr:glycosyltransferase family 4 protein [Candidatus Thermoplasmatota archaeon]
MLKRKGVDVSLNSKDDDFDIIHAHTFGPLALSQKRKSTSIISAHSTPSINKGNIVSGGRSFWKPIYQKIYNTFDYVFAVSQNSVQELREIGITKPIFVLENGVNNSFFYYDEKKGKQFRNKYGFSKQDYVVLNVAQITPRKGVYDFIRLAEKNPSIKFLWIGGFPYFIGSSDYLKIKNMIKKVPEN